MTIIDFEPLTVAVPLWEDPAGVIRVGKSRVLLEIVLRAFQQGDSPEAIVRSYKTLRLADVYALISRYLEDPAPFDEYLRQCDEQAQAMRRKVEEAGMAGRITKEELLARAKAQGVISFLVDQNFNEDIVDGLTRRDPELEFVLIRDQDLEAADDPTILAWAAEHGLVLLTHDRSTIPRFVYERIVNGLSTPGVFVVSSDMPVGAAVEELLLAAHCLSPDECRDRVIYFPM
jgi:hypothetical protein